MDLNKYCQEYGGYNTTFSREFTNYTLDQLKLMSELIQGGLGDIESFDISENNIDPERFYYLFKGLKNNRSITFLNVSNNNLGEKGIESLNDAMETNRTLKTLVMCSVGRYKEIYSFDFLKVNNSLTSLDLYSCELGSKGYSNLSGAMKSNTSITDINLSNTLMNTDRLRRFLEMLKTNNTLVKLNISNNDLYAIPRNTADVLKNNNTLTHLDISDCMLSNTSFDILADLLTCNKSLTKLIARSNFGRNSWEIGGKFIKLGQCLKVNETLLELDISNCGFEEGDAISLFEGLSQNKKLSSFNISNNMLYDDDDPYLRKMLECNTTLTELDISSTGIEYANEVFSALGKNGSIKVLNISNNNLRDDGAECLFLSLRGNSTLESLNISSNQISSQSLINLSELLKSNISLDTLNISNNSLGSGFYSFFDALGTNSTITSIDVSNTLLNDDHVVYLSEILGVNETLKSINMGRSMIKIEGLVCLSEALKTNKTLTDLSVDFCSVKNFNDTKLAEMLRINTSLKTLRLGSVSREYVTPVSLINILKTNNTLTTLDINFDGIRILQLYICLNLNKMYQQMNNPIVIPGIGNMKIYCLFVTMYARNNDSELLKKFPKEIMYEIVKQLIIELKNECS